MAVSKKARRENQRRYYAKNKETILARLRLRNQTPEGRERIRRKNLKAFYRTTPELVDNLRQQQNFCCAVCKKHETLCKKPGPDSTTGLVVDHSHRTGSIRGLLCNSCNTLLGSANDSIEVLAEAIRYLAESGCVHRDPS